MHFTGLDSAVVEVQEMFSSHGVHLTNAMYHHVCNVCCSRTTKIIPPYISLCRTCDIWDHFWPQEDNLIKFGRGLPGYIAYQISKTCGFREESFKNFHLENLF